MSVSWGSARWRDPEGRTLYLGGEGTEKLDGRKSHVIHHPALGWELTITWGQPREGHHGHLPFKESGTAAHGGRSLLLSPCTRQHMSPGGWRRTRVTPRAQPLQLELATLSFPASSVLHRHNIIPAHGCRFLLVCSHKSPSRDKPAEMWGAAQVSLEQPWQTRHEKQGNMSPKKSKRKTPSCFPRPQQSSGTWKEGFNPKIGAVTSGDPFQHGANTWRKHWKIKTPDKLENGWICVYPRPSNHIKLLSHGCYQLPQIDLPLQKTLTGTKLG